METKIIKKIIMLDLENKMIYISSVTKEEMDYLCDRGYIVRIVNPTVNGQQVQFADGFKYIQR